LEDTEEDDRLRVEIEWELTFAASAVGHLASARTYAESALRTAERLDDPDLVARALGEFLTTFATTGEPLDHDLVARLSAMDECPAWTTYYQPSTAVAVARHAAGDFEQARPALEHAAQRALSRGEEYDRLGVEIMLAALELQMGDLDRAAEHRQAVQEGMGEFGEGLMHLNAEDALFALVAGDLEAARENIEQGAALAERAGAALQTARFTSLLAEVELLSGEPEPAHHRLKEQRDWLKAAGWGRA